MAKMKFTQIPVQCRYRPDIKANLSTWHSKIIEAVINRYDGTKSVKVSAINAINTATAVTVSGDSIPQMTIDEFIDNASSMIESGELPTLCKNMYISYSDVEWDIDMPEDDVSSEPPKPVADAPDKHTEPIVEPVFSQAVVTPVKPQTYHREQERKPTVKEDLSLAPPQISLSDRNKVWAEFNTDGVKHRIYVSLPEIPETQSDISITTDSSRISDRDAMKLFPTQHMNIRKAVFYENYGDLELHPILGTIIPIEGFTREQLIDNLVRYPHLWWIKRELDGEFVHFHDYIEIDGELHSISDVWDDLPDTKRIPKMAEYIREYVIRRYLLERDVLKIEHKYPMFGTLDPWLTLFTTPKIYSDLGYTDHIKMARACIEARVSRHKSMSSYLYALRKGVNVPDCPFVPFCDAKQCKKICPAFGEIEYLLERNGILGSKSIDRDVLKNKDLYIRAIERAEDRLVAVETTDTITTAGSLAYCAICQHWLGNQFHCAVYTLNYAQYLDLTQKSWGTKQPIEDLEMIDIWIRAAKVLIISNIDYVQFKEYQAQVLLNIIQERRISHSKTIVVTPKISTLSGSGNFFTRLIQILKEGASDK